MAVDVVHEHNAEHSGQIGEAPAAPYTPLHDHERQVCDERHPDLYLDGIGTLAVEVPEREVLLELLEQEFYFPSFTIDCHDVFHFHVHVIGKQGH